MYMGTGRHIYIFIYVHILYEYMHMYVYSCVLVCIVAYFCLLRSLHFPFLCMILVHLCFRTFSTQTEAV